ncbi:MAG: S41 family peptidase [Bacteroidota bacterium]
MCALLRLAVLPAAPLHQRIVACLWVFGSFALLGSPPASAQPVTLHIDMGGVATLSADAVVGVRGNTAPLSWGETFAMTDPDGDAIYAAELFFPEGTALVEYKIVVASADGELQWEPGQNRILLPRQMTRDRRAFAGAQTDLPALVLTGDQLREDIRVLRNGMAALHPGLLLHNTEAEVAALYTRLTAQVDQLAAQYDDAVPMPAAYPAFVEAVGAIRDGHTQVSMYNQGPLVTTALYASANRVPFAFRLVGDRMIVTGDATTDRVLPLRTEVLSLDGRPVAEVLRSLMPYASADGANDAKRLDELEVDDLLAPAERFDVLYPLLYPPQADLALRVRYPDGTETDLDVARVTQDARRELLWARNATLPRSADDLLTFRMAGSTAILAIGSFSTNQMRVNYEEWLVDAFQQMRTRGAERLVVDLRGVDGGMDNAATLLFQHLLQRPVEVGFWQGVTAYEVVPEAVRPFVRSWDDRFYDLTDDVTPGPDGQFVTRTRAPVSIQPAAAAFRGPIAVLVDATASSATFYLAKQIKETDVALLVGQETGGSLKGLNGGQMVFLTLPNTTIAADVPLYGSRPALPGPDRGVTPDIVVPLDADAVIAGRDPELEAALAALSALSSGEGK